MQINRRDFGKAGAYTALAEMLPKSVQANEYQVGAYYFPNFHVDPRNEQFHGKGWTEWEVLKRGEPRFVGHLQPKRPLWGYEDESKPSVFERKLAAAHDAGITHFIFDWYWYEGKPFLQSALEEGYQHAANKDAVRFCLMWANHDWINLMPARLHTLQKPLIYKGTYDSHAFEVATDYILSHYFQDPSYFLVDGSPYFSIYELKNLIDRMGGIEIARAALRRFQEKTRAAGFRDLHLNAVAWGVQDLPDARSVLPSLGIRSVTSYAWIHHYDLHTFPATPYRDAMESAPAYWSKAREMFGVPYHVDVSMGWDASPRTCQSDIFERADYPFTPVLTDNSPELFRRALVQAKSHLDLLNDQPKILTINAWNEWTEGSYLEPDSVHGMSYLNAIRNVFRS